MRRLVGAALVAAFGLRADAVSPPPPPQAEIAALLEEQAAAWTRGDLEAFCAVYADDATFISPSGLTKGRQAVLDRYRQKYVNKIGMGALTLAIQEVRALGAGSASLVARWTLTWPDKPKAEGLTLLVVRKTKNGWRIVQDASM
jgi:beta-aspartyl-peptidase (threonine type)